MTKTFTQNDIIRYIYKETSDEENAEIESALMCDIVLQETYQELFLTSKQLDLTEIVPSDKIIRRVLNYSKSIDMHA